MSISELWKFISENAEALSVLLALTAILGGVIGFFLKILFERFSKSAEKRSNKNKDLLNTISNLENENATLKNELSQYNLVTPSDEGEVPGLFHEAFKDSLAILYLSISS